MIPMTSQPANQPVNRRGLQASGTVFLAAMALVCMASPLNLNAQDRLVGSRVLAAAATIEGVSFGSDGYMQPGTLGGDSISLKSIQQYSVPISLVLPLGSQWTVDLQSAFVQSRLTWAEAGSSATENHETSLSGMTDVRLRATGRLLDDAVVLTAGVNLPTGQSELDGNGMTVLRATAAPALALGVPPVGAGPAATLGMVYAREWLGWAVAVGASYETRGKYQPVAAMAAGLPSLDFKPGNVIRGSLGLDRLIGAHRLSITAAADVYGNDKLESESSGYSDSFASVQLGPIITTDLQLQLAIPQFREFVVWGVNRYRSRYEQNSIGVEGTNGNYFDAGVRTTSALSANTDVLVTADMRMHSGLASSQGLATSGVTAFGATAGLVRRSGGLSFQPYLRAQTGTLRPRESGTAANTSFTGFSAGLVIVTRF